MHQKSLKQCIVKLLPISLFSVVTFGIYMPSVLFLGNLDELKIDYYKVFPIVLCVGAVAFLAENSLGFLLRNTPKLWEIYADLLFSCTLGFYLQGNFLNVFLPRLDGNEIRWEEFREYDVLSVIAWMFCVIFPIVLSIYEFHKWDKMRKYGCWFLSAMQMLALVILIVTSKRTVPNDIVVTSNGLFELSKQDNIVVFVVDTLDAQWAEQYILEDEQNKDVVKDFTYFDNVVSGGAPTILGMPALITGFYYEDPFHMDVDEYYQKAYAQSTLFKDLSEKDYDVKVYTNMLYLNHADIENIRNVDTIEVLDESYKIASLSQFTSYLYRFAAYYAMPYPLKRYFAFYSGDFTQCIDAKVTLSGEEYKINDAKFYQKLREDNLSISNEEKNVFVLYHLNGAHSPYGMNEYCEEVEKEETSLEQQIQGEVVILSEYLEQMKELGVYDASTIIITADHGGVGLYQNPAVFIKRPFAINSEAQINSAPAMFRNVRASIAEAFLEDYSVYGPGLFDDMTEYETDGRDHTVAGGYRTLSYSDKRTGYEYDRYKVVGSARDLDSIMDINPYTEGN